MSSKSGVTIKISDKGASRSAASLFGANKAAVKVGVFGPKGEETTDDGALTMAALAAIHEFGLGVPERSFIRSYFDAHEKQISEALIKLTKAALTKALERGKPVTEAEMLQVLNKMGLFMVGEMQKRIGNGDITPPLAQQTIDRKGSSTPLIDTGQLRSSISHEAELNK